MFITFIDILYALAIGTGFISFPISPEKNILGTFMFIYTLLISAHDWYEYHDKADIVPEKHRFFYYILQILVILVLNQMFRHSVTDSLVLWLIYAGIYCSLNAFWNIITPFKNHYLYVATSTFLSIIAFLMAGFYQTIINYFPAIDGRWIIVSLSIAFPLGISFFEKRIDK